MLQEKNNSNNNKKRKRSFVKAYTDLRGDEQFSESDEDSDNELPSSEKNMVYCV